MNLRDVQIFAEAAQRGSFTAVASARGIDPSSVSRAIAGLEEALGVRLFDRSTRRIALTDAGELYLSRVVPLIEEIERLGAKARDARQGPIGTLRLAAPVALGQRLVLPHLARFRDAHPGLRIQCLFGDTLPDVEGERIDLALRLSPSSAPSLVTSELCRTGMRLVAAPRYLRDHPQVYRPADLAAHQCLLPPDAEFRATWSFCHQTGERVAQPITGSIAVASAGGIHSAVRAGLGLALLPGWLVADDLIAGELHEPLPDWHCDAPDSQGTVYMAYPARDLLPFKTRAVMEFLRRAV